MKSVKILSVPVHAVSRLELLVKLEEFIASKKPHQVTTVNAEFVMTAQRNTEFKEVLQGADLSVADGSGIMWAARFLGNYLPERIPGADLVHDIAKAAAEKGWKFYLIGGADGVAEKTAKKLAQRYEAVRIVGAEVGLSYREGQSELFDEQEVAALVARIQKAQPDILLVALGAPKQELFIARFKKELGVPVMIGVGGTFDFLVGRVKRVPRWLRRIGLESIWRLIQEPKRFKRVWTALVVFPLAVIGGVIKKRD